MAIGDAYDNADVEFKIDQLEMEDDAESFPGSVELEYARPAISVDNKARFVTHEIIGGTTVRQKIGEEPRELTVKGVCKENTAIDFDALKDAKEGRVFCNRLPDNSMDAQFASVSTSPLDDGGGVAIDDGEFLYNFNLKILEVNE